MAKKSGLNHGFYAGGYDISGDVSALNQLVVARPSLDLTGISQLARERAVGKSDAAIAGRCWWNDASNALHDALSSMPTTDVDVLYRMGITLGDPCAMMRAEQTNYDWDLQADGSLPGSFRFEGTAGLPLVFGRLLTAGAISQSSAGSETGIVDSAQTTNGLEAWLQVISFTGTSITVSVEDSSDTTNGTDGTWGNLVSFAAATGGQTTERVTVSGNVELGLRVNTSGTFTECTFIVGIRRGTAQDDLSL
jgi:hypothetical protein